VHSASEVAEVSGVEGGEVITRSHGTVHLSFAFWRICITLSSRPVWGWHSPFEEWYLYRAAASDFYEWSRELCCPYGFISVITRRERVRAEI